MLYKLFHLAKRQISWYNLQLIITEVGYWRIAGEIEWCNIKKYKSVYTI